MDVKVHISGPIFDGRAVLAVEDFLDEAVWEVGEQGWREVHEQLERNLRNPTGYYQSHITVERQGEGVIVHDKDVIYSFWLEGIAEKRDRRAQFPGYHSFALAAVELERQVGPLAERALPPYLARMQ